MFGHLLREVHVVGDREGGDEAMLQEMDPQVLVVVDVASLLLTDEAVALSS